MTATVRRLRRMRSDEDGVSLVELLVATFLIAIGFAAILGLVGASLTASHRTRRTDVAANAGNEEVERYRSIRYDKIALDDGSGAPSTHDGLDVVLADCPDCPAHQETLERDGIEFTITRWVLAVDDDADGTDGDDEDGETTDYKRVQVIVAWDTPTSGSTEIVSNILPDETTDPPPTGGISIDIRDAEDTDDPKRLIDEDDEEVQFPIEVIGPVNTDALAIEGEADIIGLPAGTYSCVIHRASILYYPEGEPLAESTTVNCSFTDPDDIVEITSLWVKDDCASDGSTTADATVTVVDSEGDPVQGASVTISGPANQPSPPAGDTTATTDGSGVASFPGELVGRYEVTATHPDFETKTGQLCIRESGGTTTVTMNTPAETGEEPAEGETTPPPSCATVNVTVTNDKDEDKTFRIYFEQKDEPKDEFYEPAAGGGPPDPGVVIPPGESHTFTRCVTANTDEGFKYEIEIERLKKPEENDWDGKKKWNEDLVNGETYDFAEEVG